MNISNAIDRMIADDAQLDVLEEIVNGSPGDCLGHLKSVDLLKLLGPRGQEPTELNMTAVKTLHSKIGELLECIKSIRSGKENIAMTESKIHIIKKTCMKETAPFINVEQLLDDSPSSLASAVEKAEENLRNRQQQVEEQTATFERLIDEAQESFNVWKNQAKLRLVNSDNHEEALQHMVYDLLAKQRAWTAEDTLEIRFGRTVFKLKFEVDRAKCEMKVVECQTSGMSGDLDKMKEMNLRWNNVSTLLLQLAVRHEQERRILAEVEELRRNVSLVWNPEQWMLQLVTNSRGGETVVCRFRPLCEGYELVSISGAAMDSAAVCAKFKMRTDASIASVVEDLVALCNSH